MSSIIKKENGNCLVIILIIVVVVLVVAYNVSEQERLKDEGVDVAALKGSVVQLSYDDLARYPDENKGKPVRYQGKVVQKVSDTGLRIGTKEGSFGSWDEVIYANLRSQTKDVGVLEGDIVEFIGVTDGEQKATTIFGQSVALPRINIYEIEVIQKRQ